MKKYLLRSIPKTEIEIPEKPSELVQEELGMLNDFVSSEVAEFIMDPDSFFHVEKEVEDDDGNIEVTKEIRKGSDIARKLVLNYATGRLFNAIEEEVLDELYKGTKFDPFLFMAQHSIFGIYEKILMLNKPELFEETEGMFKEGSDFYHDAFTVGFSLAYSQKKGKPLDESLADLFITKMLKKEPVYSFLLDSVVYLCSDAKDNTIIH